jgi:hypothetical protein
MKARQVIGLVVAACGLCRAAAAWDSYRFDLPVQAPEAAWRDALAAELNAQHEVPVEGGRVDVLSAEYAIELDWPHKWHEGLGQALHYADATGRKPALALIAYSQSPDHLRDASRERFEMVERSCAKRGVKLMILFPSQPRARETAAGKAEAPTNFWLNTETGVRHRPGCRFYRGTLEGRPCGPDEGTPCSRCSGRS